MPIEKKIYIQNLDEEFTYTIGKNANDNFTLIDNSQEDDFWFHLKDQSSSHVVVKMDKNYKKKELSYILKQGAILCKQHSKQKNLQGVPIIYTKIKNVTKTEIPGSVIIKNEKTINI